MGPEFKMATDACVLAQKTPPRRRGAPGGKSSSECCKSRASCPPKGHRASALRRTGTGTHPPAHTLRGTDGVASAHPAGKEGSGASGGWRAWKVGGSKGGEHGMSTHLCYPTSGWRLVVCDRRVAGVASDSERLSTVRLLHTFTHAHNHTHLHARTHAR